MKLLIDALLPRLLSRRLSPSGHDSIHTMELSIGKPSGVSVLAAIASHHERMPVSIDEPSSNHRLVEFGLTSLVIRR